MDNAPYHSVLVENVPKSNTKKSDVQKWLSEKDIDFSLTETLAELREKVKIAKPREKRYQLDGRVGNFTISYGLLFSVIKIYLIKPKVLQVFLGYCFVILHLNQIH